MKGLTTKRLEVLKFCADATGHTPGAAEWQAIYWLRSKGLVRSMEVARTTQRRRYSITDAGRALLPSPQENKQCQE